MVPNASLQPGEWHSQGKVGAVMRLTKDGPTAGDGKGGVQSGGGGLVKQYTSSGHTAVFDDTAKTMTLTSARG